MAQMLQKILNQQSSSLKIIKKQGTENTIQKKGNEVAPAQLNSKHKSWIRYREKIITDEQSHTN